MYLLRTLSIILLLLVFLIGCSESKTQDKINLSEDSQISLFSDDGERLILDKIPKRIIAFDAATVEILFKLGMGENIIGTHGFANYPPEAENIEKLGDSFNINLEKVIELDPDLFFTFSINSIKQLREANIPVYFKKSPRNISQILERITMWGNITGKQIEAQNLVESLQSKLNVIKGFINNRDSDKKPSIFHDVGDYWTTGNDTFVGSIYQMLNVDNIAFDITEWKQISQEQIVSRNPDIIITTFKEGPEKYYSSKAFSTINAVKNKKVYFLDPTVISVEGPRIISAIETLAKWIYDFH